MKKVMIWFLLSCKRYVRKPSFLVILLLLPLGILAADKSQGHKDPEIKIAVSVQGGDENELGARLAQSLVERRLGEDAGLRAGGRRLFGRGHPPPFRQKAQKHAAERRKRSEAIDCPPTGRNARKSDCRPVNGNF